MEGWIKLHRRLKHWEWRTSPKHVAVFLDLLLEANHEQKKYRGKVIEPGQLTTSYKAISVRTGVSMQSVRTILKDLKATHEITHETTRHYSIITITKWSDYQMTNTQTNNLTNNLLTPNKNVINKRNNNICSKFDLEALYQNYPRKEGKKKGLEKLQREIKTKEQYDKVLIAVQNYANECKTENRERQYIKHFSTWVSVWEDYLETEQPKNEQPKIYQEINFDPKDF